MSEVIPFKRNIGPQDLVLRFLNSVGHKRDAEFYLKLFSSTRPESFALIVLDEEILKDDIDVILFEIRYLIRLQLFPVVLIRSSNDFLEKIDIEAYFKRAHIALNLLDDDCSDDDRLDFIKKRIQQRSLPLLHLDPDLNPVSEISKLATILRTGKVIFLRRAGGILNTKTEELISIINLKFEREPLIKENKIKKTDAKFLTECEKIINECPHKLYISIVSPNNLLRELFTVKGAGTLLQRGSSITSLDSWDTIDPKSLKRLLESSFEKPINDAFFKAPINAFHIEENYMGAALLKSHADAWYLSKFAVGTEARGLGIGRDIWSEILKKQRRFFWRSRPDKFITHWYTKQCDGLFKTKDWTIFWKNMDPSEISDAIQYAIEQPIDFKE